MNIFFSSRLSRLDSTVVPLEAMYFLIAAGEEPVRSYTAHDIVTRMLTEPQI